jgi:hypothetical protein
MSEVRENPDVRNQKSEVGKAKARAFLTGLTGSTGSVFAKASPDKLKTCVRVPEGRAHGVHGFQPIVLCRDLMAPR